MLRCVVCRSRRTTYAAMKLHAATSGHRAACTCGGYPFPHRPGSPTCIAHPYVRSNDARRAGADAEEILDAFIEDALFNRHKPAPPEEIPF